MNKRQDYSTPLGSIAIGQGDQATKANGLFNATSPAALYGLNYATTTGLTFGYHGGHPTLSSGAIGTIADGTLTLTASTTNYITAPKETGTPGTSTATTNWNDKANYWRLYSVVTNTTGITGHTDYREIGKMTGGGGGSGTSYAPVTKTTAFTLGANENEVIVNGSASITATLPAASSFVGRKVRIKTRAAYPVISASSNVKPIDTDTAGTAILPGIAGRWVELLSDGTNWVVMSQGGDDNEFTAAVTKTGDFTLAISEQFVICNGSASITVTLPSAATRPGRAVTIKTRAAYPVVSASSNVKPLDTDTAGTAILAATAGKWAQMVSDGTDWIIMAGN